MITLFSTPKPFRGHIGVIQRNALESWKRLHSDAEIILFGDDEGTAEICHELDLRYEPQVLRSNYGTKRLDSIFDCAQQLARHDTICYVNCDIILTREFLHAQQTLSVWRSRFLMVGRRWDTDITEALDFRVPDWEARIVGRAKNEGIKRFYHNIDYFLFPRGLYPKIPPLVIGRIWWDHWLVGKALSLGVAVVDVSEVVCAVHQNHDYGYHPRGMEGVWRDEEARSNHELARSDCRLATIEDAPYRLTAAGIEQNRFCWLAPIKRHLRQISKKIRAAGRTIIWHPLLDATRPVRHVIGIRKSAAMPSSGERKHGMDQ